MAKNKQNISELAKNLGLPEVHTKQIVEMLKHDILLSLYRKDPMVPEYLADFNVELNNKIAKVYQEKYGSKFNPKVHEKNKIIPLFLMGPPGQGKTASFEAAAREVCADLGLRFVSHVGTGYVPDRRDFLFVVQETAGENSPLTIGGLPERREVTWPDGSKEFVTGTALNQRFLAFKHAAGGVLLFDDVANAIAPIQNVLLPVAQNGTFRDLKINNACIGFTGNLGAVDGTHVQEQSSALNSRVYKLFVTDTVEDFVARGYLKYNDDLGDLGYFSFLKRNTQDFMELPEAGSTKGFACSRTHDNFIQGARSKVEMHGGRGVGEEKALREIHILAYSCFGPEMANKVVSYYNSYIQGADPLAKKFITTGNIDKDELKKKYNGGTSDKDMSFGYQFATACGDYTVNMIASAKDMSLDGKEFTTAIQRFGKSVLGLNDSEFSFALEHLKNKLSAYVTNYSKPSKEGPTLKSEVREKIAMTINDLEDCTIGMREILIEVITDFNKMPGTTSMGAKRKREEI